jgi:hypothetical protein
MGLNRSDSIKMTDMSNQETEFSVSIKTLLSPTTDESYFIPEFDTWNGYYEAIPEAKAIIDTLIRWIMGKGFKGDVEKLKRIVGNGKENALKVLKNVRKQSKICGHGFAEIVRDPSNKSRIVNLKALNPSRVRVVYNKSGVIIGFDDLNYIKDEKFHRYGVDEIFYQTNGRIGDSMDSCSFFQAIEQLMLNRNEVIADLKVMFHRFVKPVRLWEAETDNKNQIIDIAAQIDEVFKKTENLVVPKDTLKLAESSAIPTQTGGLNPLDYYRELIHAFISACSVPEVIMGWTTGTSEGNSKIVYIGWQQTIEDEQLDEESDVEIQLGAKINLEFPIDLMQAIATDAKKDKTSGEKKSELKPGISKEEKKPVSEVKA